MAVDPPAGAAEPRAFVSVTYGAGGSTRQSAPTAYEAMRMLTETTLRPAAHLTCVEASKAEVDEVIDDYWAAGIRHIVALRGDPPGQIGGAYVPRADGYSNATELTAGIRARHPFEVSASLYPQTHPESPSPAHDIDVLKAKIDAGASRAITQFFFDIDGFLRFADQVRAAGVTIPISVGIMPVNNVKGLARMAGQCGISHPRVDGRGCFEGLDEDPDTRRLIACIGGGGDVCAARGGGLQQFPLLHPQPGGPRLRHLSGPGGLKEQAT